MTADIIQAEYEQLESIANRFNSQAENNAVLLQRITQAVDALQQGGWEGLGAAAFYSEMNQTIYPIVHRLIEALEEAGTVTLTVRDIIRTAEEEAASLFDGRNAEISSKPFGEGLGFAPGGEGTAVPTNISSHSLVEKAPSQVFNEDYMERFIGSRFRGGDSAELNRLMEDLIRADPANQAHVNSLLNRIADIRGVDRAEFQAQYEKFLILRSNAGPVTELDLNRYSDYLGSTVSLRFGAVLGDVFGIDPVFGSLLSPTGGIVGPGNGYYAPGENDAIGYHGIFHDAAGYLYNHHDSLGPGYDYLDREPFNTSNPLTGQVGGISWWSSHLELDVDVLPNIVPDIPYVPHFIEKGVSNLVESVPITPIRIGTYVFEKGADLIDDVGDVISQGASNIIFGPAGTVASQIFGWP